MFDRRTELRLRAFTGEAVTEDQLIGEASEAAVEVGVPDTLVRVQSLWKLRKCLGRSVRRASQERLWRGRGGAGWARNFGWTLAKCSPS